MTKMSLGVVIVAALQYRDVTSLQIELTIERGFDPTESIPETTAIANTRHGTL